VPSQAAGVKKKDAGEKARRGNAVMREVGRPRSDALAPGREEMVKRKTRSCGFGDEMGG